MTFDVAAGAYGRFMGRYSEPLAVKFVDLVGVAPGRRALDVGCGPGALTAVLVDRLGASSVSAVEPSASFVSAVRERLPGVDVRSGAAEKLPFDDAQFDVALAQLVVHFMKDPVAGLSEMARVTRPGGVVAASVWDHGSGRGPLTPFWRGVHHVRPEARDEGWLVGSREGQLVELAQDAGLTDARQHVLTVKSRYETFDEWWEPFTLGVGPAGEYVAGLDDAQRRALRQACAQVLGDPPFEIPASAWCVVARVRDRH